MGKQIKRPKCILSLFHIFYSYLLLSLLLSGHFLFHFVPLLLVRKENLQAYKLALEPSVNKLCSLTPCTNLNRSSWLINSCCCLVVKSCPTLRDPMDQSTPGPPVFQGLPEMGQSHVGRFEDPVQPSRPLSSPSLLLLPSHFPNIRVFSRES